MGGFSKYQMIGYAISITSLVDSWLIAAHFVHGLCAVTISTYSTQSIVTARQLLLEEYSREGKCEEERPRETMNKKSSELETANDIRGEYHGAFYRENEKQRKGIATSLLFALYACLLPPRIGSQFPLVSRVLSSEVVFIFICVYLGCLYVSISQWISQGATTNQRIT